MRRGLPVLLLLICVRSVVAFRPSIPDRDVANEADEADEQEVPQAELLPRKRQLPTIGGRQGLLVKPGAQVVRYEVAGDSTSAREDTRTKLVSDVYDHDRLAYDDGGEAVIVSSREDSPLGTETQDDSLSPGPAALPEAGREADPLLSLAESLTAVLPDRSKPTIRPGGFPSPGSMAPAPSDTNRPTMHPGGFPFPDSTAPAASDTNRSAESVEEGEAEEPASEQPIAKKEAAPATAVSPAHSKLVSILQQGDPEALRSHLAEMAGGPEPFDPNSVLVHPAAPPGAAPSDNEAPDAPGAAPSAPPGMPMLHFAASGGWLAGVACLMDWDRGRTDAGERIFLEAPGPCGTPLLCAARNGHATVTHHLSSRRASVLAVDRGQTPLEIAASARDYRVTEALLAGGSELEGGLARLRAKIAGSAAKLPRWPERWPGSSWHSDQMARMREDVPKPLRPSSAVREVVGDVPWDWMLLYMNRVMRAHATGPELDIQLGPPQSDRTSSLLAAHGFDAFARHLSLTVVCVFVAASVFALLAYVVCRLRLYGGWEAPASTAHLLPGAFDPLRLADPDFDPRRRGSELPYRATSAYLNPHAASMKVMVSAFVKAVLGVFSSWSLLCVRIPLEQDENDEDYASDDDEESRGKVREHGRERARSLRDFEVALRIVSLLALLWWFCWRTRRWAEASLLIVCWAQHSCCAACVAVHAVPPVAPERAGSDNEEDAATAVSALFSAQHGPRWGRSMRSTRSTASPQKRKFYSRRRPRRRVPPKFREEAQADAHDSASEAGEDSLSAPSGSPAAAEASGPVPSRGVSWQRAFIEANLLDSTQGAVVVGSLGLYALVGLAVLWLTHVRWLASDDLGAFYQHHEPEQLFAVYGAPGGLRRGAAVFLECLFLALACERLHGAASLLQVAALALWQRQRALEYAQQQTLPEIGIQAPEPQLVIESLRRYVDASARRTEFVTELSALRWAVLRVPVLVVFMSTIKCLGLASFYLGLLYCRVPGADASLYGFAFDPMVLVCIGLCFALPLTCVLTAAAASNTLVRRQASNLQCAAHAALSALPEGDNDTTADCAALRVKAAEALNNNFVTWPGGFRVSYAEPVLLVMLIGLTGTASVVVHAL